jgi:hypothetical protein
VDDAALTASILLFCTAIEPSLDGRFPDSWPGARLLRGTFLDDEPEAPSLMERIANARARNDDAALIAAELRARKMPTEAIALVIAWMTSELDFVTPDSLPV